MQQEGFLYQHLFQSRHIHSQKPVKERAISEKHYVSVKSILTVSNYISNFFSLHTFGPLRRVLSNLRLLANISFADVYIWQNSREAEGHSSDQLL